MPADRKHHIQRWTPNTCDSIMVPKEVFDGIGDPFDPRQFNMESIGGCKLLQYFYTDMVTLLNSVPVVAGYDQICPAHEVPTNAGAGKFLWHTGNWKPTALLIPEQRLWYLWLNYKEWLAKGRSLASMPGQIKFLDDGNRVIVGEVIVSGTLRTVEPQTPATVAMPSAAEINDLTQVATWNIEHNARVGIAKQIIDAELSKDAGAEDTTTWSYSGKGDDRVLTITDKDGLTAGELSKIEGAMDVQFGAGKVVVG